MDMLRFRVKYDTFDILTDDEVRQGLKKFSNWPTYPQLYVSGELLGGLDIIKVPSASISVLFFILFFREAVYHLN